ncbi:MAG: hypothetical protein PHP13_06835 [Methanomicrobium sp.]|nr:hypothetical protein [Methanomicrobium sp.]
MSDEKESNEKKGFLSRFLSQRIMNAHAAAAEALRLCQKPKMQKKKLILIRRTKTQKKGWQDLDKQWKLLRH